jgi:two-component system OmpR family response regulator/two-component system response regulator QseB
MRILLAEDDPELGDALRAGLRLSGFQVDWVRDGVAAAHELKATPYAAAVLDIGLPRQDGWNVLTQLREQENPCPVLMLTARDAPADMTTALDLGADDYVVKPVDLEVLAARLRALIRRASGFSNASMVVGPLRLDPASRQVTLQGQHVSIVGKEFEILQALMLADGRILTREALSRHLYQWGEDVDSNTVEVHIHHLRRKLGPQGKQLVATVRGIGYQIRAA